MGIGSRVHHMSRPYAWIAGAVLALVTFLGAFTTAVAVAGASVGPPKTGDRR